MNGADLLVETLAKAGVRRIFSLSGNQIMPIYNACPDTKIQIIHTRHEAAAVFMADAWAQLTGQIGVALVTAAPGAANALGPLFTARQSESPVLFLTGDSPVSKDGQGAFQELDQVAMTTPLTKLSIRVNSASDLGADTARAIRTALSGRPGPVHMSLPADILNNDVKSGPTPPLGALNEPCAPEDIDRISRAIKAACRPLILCGPAMSPTRTGAMLAELSDATDAPVVAMESPRGLNDPGLGSFSQAMAKADLIVSLGKPVNFTLDFGASGNDCVWIMVDAERAELDRARLNLKHKLVQAVRADPQSAALALTADPVGHGRADWCASVAALIAARNPAPDKTDIGDRITSAALVAATQRQIAAAANSVVICDGGEFGQWAQAGTSGTFRIINGPSGAIGGGLCYAIAAKKAKPEANVFAFMGDGTVGFHLAEFETAAREGTAFVVIIGNDRRWNAEHQIQLRDYGCDRLLGCQLSAARYDKAATALGGYGEYVTRLADLDAALARAVDSGKAACVNVMIEGQAAPKAK